MKIQLQKTTATTIRRPGTRLKLPLALGIACLLVVSMSASVSDVSESPTVTVREDQGLYTVQASFVVGHPASVVVEVLTDYNEIARFMPDVRTSQLLERQNGFAVVEQEAVARWMMFSKRVHLVLEIVEDHATIRFRDRCGTSFRRYEGVWRLTEAAGTTTIAYQLSADPAFTVPGFLLERLLGRDATQMMEALRDEITARAGTAKELRRSAIR